ncbi:MAG: carbohydrate ABC transporter permease [Sphaerochaeta sp.]
MQPFARHYVNTLLVATIGTLGNVFVAAMAGYSFARIRFPGRNAAFLLLLTALMMPIEVTIIPLFFQMRSFGALDTLIPLMLIPIFGSQGAFSAFMLRQFFVTVPVELEEAARIDGLNPFSIFTKIMLPIAIPVLSSVGILAFIAIWNTYLEPLVFLNSLEKYTLPLSLTNFNDTYGLPQWNLQLAATALSIVPIMVVYLIFQQKVSNAMVGSGLK